MPFSEEDKHFIKVLREEKQYSSRRFLKEFPNRDWSRKSLDKLLRKIEQDSAPSSRTVRRHIVLTQLSSC
jgi:hypothetical protein